MQQQVPSHVTGLAAQWAAENLRAGRYVHGIAGRLDKLVEAVVTRDRVEVRRISKYIARSAATYGCPAVAVAATDLAVAAIQTDDVGLLKRRVIELIGACGRIRQSAKMAA